MTNKKYELTDIRMRFTFDGTEYTLHRIRAVNNIDYTRYQRNELSYLRSVDQEPGVLRYTYGGWVESEYNLDQDGSCWLHHESKCFGNSKVVDDALMFHTSIVSGYTILCGTSIILNQTVFNDACCFEAADGPVNSRDIIRSSAEDVQKFIDISTHLPT